MEARFRGVRDGPGDAPRSLRGALAGESGAESFRWRM